MSDHRDYNTDSCSPEIDSYKVTYKQLVTQSAGNYQNTQSHKYCTIMNSKIGLVKKNLSKMKPPIVPENSSKSHSPPQKQFDNEHICNEGSLDSGATLDRKADTEKYVDDREEEAREKTYEYYKPLASSEF